MREQGQRVVLVALGVTQLALAAFMAIAPQDFHDTLGPWGPVNDHYVRDVATIYGAIGAAALVAVSRPAWRAPVLALAAFQYALHALNHLVDITEADPEWWGYAVFVLLVATTAALAWLARA